MPGRDFIAGILSLRTSGTRSLRAPGTRSPRSPTTRSPPSGDRAVSPVIGAVLMLAVLIVAMTVLQVTAVPILNAQHEFEHSQAVQSDLVRLETAVDRVAATGTGETATVDVGVRYPQRLVFVNPPPASGRLRTTEPRSVTIANARAAGETGDYWNGTARSFETATLVYSPAYREYGGAPTTVYEPWVVYNRMDGGTAALTETDLIEGRQISFVALDGEYARSAAGTVGVNAVPNSAPVRTVTVENGTGPIRITVPTGLRNDTWTRLLADELDRGGDDDRHVTGIACAQEPPEPCGELTLTLEPGTYELRLGEVAVGSGSSREGAHYLTTASPPSATIPEGAEEPVTVEVRDRFNVPVTGVDVAFSSPDGSFDAATATSDDDGRATALFTPDATGTATITARADLDGDGRIQPREEVTVTREVTSTSGGGGGGGGVGTGEVSQWTADNTSETISQQGGVWAGLDGVSTLTASDARFTPVRPSDQQFDSDNEYLRFVLVFEAGDTKYVYEFTDSKDGVKRSAGGAWGDRKVNIYRKSGDATYSLVGSAELSETRLDALYRGQQVDLLDQRNYDSGRDAVVSLRNFLRSNQDVDVYVADMDGRVTLTAE